MVTLKHSKKNHLKKDYSNMLTNNAHLKSKVFTKTIPNVYNLLFHEIQLPAVN